MPDIIHLNILWPAGLFAYYLKIFFKKKYIITENWTGYLKDDNSYSRSSKIRKFLTRIISRGAELITPVSRDLQQAMEKHNLGSKFEIIYNVANPSVFYPLHVSKRADKTIFLHVSTTLDEQKNVSGILNAVKKLSEKRNDFELKIVSEKDFSSHEKTASELGILDKYVFFESVKTADGIAEEMRKAHCFVLFSNYENLPVVMCEAMMSGLPVISSAVGGVPEHITDKFGLLVQSHDTVGLCKAMEYMMDNIEKYNSAEICNYAIENFSYDAVGKKFYTIYKKIISV
jgi:glycosyltransferase involved in cell wall biosynthesis